MTTVSSLYEQLGRHMGKGRGDLPVIAIHGASGEASDVGGVYIEDVGENDEIMQYLTENAKQYVVLYTGN